MGGSGLHAFDQTPEVIRQVDLMRSAMENDMHVLGSCWGLQIAAAATGGTVSKSPRGREVGIARKIAVTQAGAGHALYAISRMFSTVRVFIMTKLHTCLRIGYLG